MPEQCDQIVDTELQSDRAGHEAVGGGHQRTQIAVVEVTANQRAGLGADGWQDTLGHELPVPIVELLPRITGQRLQLKSKKLVNVERARLVLRVERIVFGGMDLGVEHSLADQELRPFIITVTGQQGVVEVEQSEIHVDFCVEY